MPVLVAFAVAVLALVAAFARELVCRHSIRQAARSVRVARSGGRDQRVAPGR
jgi:hypothetical protein